MSQPVQVELLSDDDDDQTLNHHTLITPVSNHLKRPRLELQPNPITFLIIDDDPTPEKLRGSASSTPSFVPETPLSELQKPQGPPIVKCKENIANPSCGYPGSGSGHRLSGVGGLICLESDDEDEEGLRTGNWQKNKGTYSDYDMVKALEESPKCYLKESQWQNGAVTSDFHVEKCSAKMVDSTYLLDKSVQSTTPDEAEGGLGKSSWLKNGGSFSDFDVQQDVEKSPKFVVKENLRGTEINYAGFDMECLEERSEFGQSTYYLGNLTSANSYNLEDDAYQVQPFHDQDYDKENNIMEEVGAVHKLKSKGKGNAQKKQSKDEQAGNKRKSKEGEKMRLMEEKKLKKEQEKLHKAALKAEAAKLRQLEKDKKRWEKGKFGKKNILAEIDPKVIQCGSIGGHLLTRLGEKGLVFNITTNPIEKSIVWRMTVPEEISHLSSVDTDIPYILLIYGAEEFCKLAIDGSLLDHISSVRSRYPSYTICCLTNRLLSYINKREQEIYNNQKDMSDWRRPPVEEVFAKLTTHFASVHYRQCADEAELAEHVVGLSVNLAKCRFRKKLTQLSVNANGCNIPKDCVDRDLIMKHTWLKALVSIPKVQPRFAIAIWKKYPTMKSLLKVYMDSSKSVHEKEFLLKDLTTEDLLGNEDRRLGEICSKRVYRILMAQHGGIKTDDVENGADFFTTQ